MKKLLISLFGLLASIIAFSANVQGTVILEDELDTPAGATVIIKGADNRLLAAGFTDISGNFSITFNCNPSSCPITITISYVGYIPFKITLPCGPSTQINLNTITLKVDNGEVDDID